VRIDPQYGAAWGALALSYTHGLDGFSEAQLPSVPPRIRAAAAKAEELDPGNADAQLAVACIRPHFRNWTVMERELRAIRDRHPDHWLANGRLAILYYQVGRLIDGANLHRGVIARDPMIPGPYAFAAQALSNAGRIQEADAILKDASDRWPANPFIWNARYNHLLFSGRPASAAALVEDPEARPSGMRDVDVEPYLTVARAAESRQPADVDRAIAFGIKIAQDDVRAIADAAPIFVMFGRLDLAFACLDRYLFDRGSFGTPSPITRYTRRYTDFLFSAPMAAMRSDRRFGELTRAIGLDDYWRTAGMKPPHFPV
jgi:tetratricopeptide (TPR) repeat protein